MAEVKPYLFDECFDEEMISASMVDAIKDQAFKEGEASGIEYARNMNETHAANVLPGIENGVRELAEIEREKLHQVSKIAASVTAKIIGKIFPSLEKMSAAAEVENFINEQVIALKNHAEYVVTVNQEMVDDVRKYLERNMQETGVNVKVAEDSFMAISDCRIEWEQGGVERMTTMLLEQVTERLSAMANENLSIDVTDHADKIISEDAEDPQIESQENNKGGEDNE